jgi:hypothetical protein
MSGLKYVCTKLTFTQLGGREFWTTAIRPGAIVEEDNHAVVRFPGHFRPATPRDIKTKFTIGNWSSHEKTD